MKKLPRLPEYPTLDEVATWLTTASDEAWSPSAVLSRLLEWEGTGVLSDGSLSQSRITTSREVWVVVPPGDAVTAQLDGAECVTREGLLVYVIEPIDSFVRTVWLCGEAVPTGGVSTRDGKRFHVTRSFSVHDVRIPKNDVFKLLPAFDQLMLELDRGEHADLARLVDDVAHSSAVNPPHSNSSVGEQGTEEDSEARKQHDTLEAEARRIERTQPQGESEPEEAAQMRADDVITDGLVAWQAVMIESWAEIAKAHQDNPTARNAMSWLKKHGPRDVFPEKQPDHDALHWIDRNGNPQTVLYASIAKRISEWRKAGILPAKK